MSGEETQSMQMLILLGQLLVPAGRECAKLLAKALWESGAWTTSRAASGASAVARGAANLMDGMGEYGQVSLRQVRRDAEAHRDTLELMDMQEACGRKDLDELRRACRELGIGFAVYESGGRSVLVFKATDSHAMALATGALLDGYGVEDGEREALTKTDAEIRGSLPEHAGLTWSEEGGQTWSATISGDGGTVRVTVSEDGSWAVRDAGGRVLSNRHGKEFSGVSTGPNPLASACQSATAYAATVTNSRVMGDPVEGTYETAERQAKDIRRATSVQAESRAATQRRRDRAQEAARTHSHTHARVVK